MIIRILYIFLAIGLIACNSNTIPKKPDNLIPKDKMVKILTESYIAKNAKYSKNLNNETNLNYLAFIYDNNQTDSITFNQSLKYYISDISLNEEILKLVKEKIDKELNILKKVQENIDSLAIKFDKKITQLKENRKKELDYKIDSIKQSLTHYFDNKTNKINNLEKAKKDSIEIRIKEIQKEYQKIIDIEINTLKKQKTEELDKKATEYKLKMLQ